MKYKEYMQVMQKILHIIDEGVHAIDLAGRTIIYNDAMAALEKMDSRYVMSHYFSEVFTGMSEDNSTLLHALRDKKSSPWREQTYLNKDGKEITTINRTMPIFQDGEVIAAIEISKTVTNLHEMSNTILELRKNKGAANSAGSKARHAPRKYCFDDLWGENAAFLKCLSFAKKAAGNDASVLLYGETGTGKELIAQSIHYASERGKRPYIAQNCAALPASLLEGILFGTSKGGFTGAIDREGIFEQANGSTLLLDEINSMPQELQGKLLRVLQEGYIRRVGGTKDIPVDIRFIATINEPADELIQTGALRKDLYYRLNVISLNIPPLRERRDDILMLANRFITRCNDEFGKSITDISRAAENILLAHDYPGNIRELENIIMSAVAMSDDSHILSENMLGIDSQAAGFVTRLRDENLYACVSRVEKEMIESALAASGHNISKAAAVLGIRRQTLQHKMSKYGMRTREYAG
jgi:arginine utilization regulatory protein